MVRDIRRLLGVVVACFAAAHFDEAGAAGANAPEPSRPARAAAPNSNGRTYPVWLQTQGYWANRPIHGMNGTIAQYGCAVTAVAMQLRGEGRTLDGKLVDPAVLNDHIQILTLESMAAAAGMSCREVDDIDEALTRGPLIVQIRYDAPPSVGGGIGPHYVLLTGKDPRGRYVVHDPLRGRRALDPQRSPLDAIEHAYQILPLTE